jgi:hypothetical protein|tara:strand:+ start:231 stop:440 length:210 start_codon:yes stop_codon:yes gene_type:complete
MTTPTPIQLLDNTTEEYKWSDSDLLEVVTQATTQIDAASGWDTESDRTPTAREILMAINNALYHHFNEE